MSPTIFVHVALLGFVPLATILFVILPPRRAILTTLLVGWLFLPVYTYTLVGLPELSRDTAISLALTIGIVVGWRQRSSSARPRWFDLPMILFCLSPVATVVSNGLGAYDALSSVQRLMFAWLPPYLAGRLFFSDWRSIRIFAIAVLIGGLLYVPLCLIEIRFSPQLHRIVYGYQQVAFYSTKRLGGFRPVGFTASGMALGLWMSVSTLTGIWLYVTRSVRTIGGIPLGVPLVVLFVVNLMCRSTGALVLFGLSLVALLSVRRFGPFLLLCLSVLPVVYMVARVSGLASGEALLTAATSFSEDRAASLNTRIVNENRLIAKALERPLFGWGAWGRNRVLDEEGRDITLTDGYWIIVLGQEGFLGLAGLYAIMLLPTWTLLYRNRGMGWSSAGVAPALVLATAATIYALDCLPNAMSNPIYVTLMGAIVGLPRFPGGGRRQKLGPAPRSSAERVQPLQPQLRRDPLKGRRDLSGGQREPARHRLTPLSRKPPEC